MVATATMPPKTKFKDKNLKALPYPEQFQELKALFEQGKIEEALTLAKTNERSEPNNVMLLNFIGIALTETRKPAEGAEYFQKAIGLEPGYADAHYNYGKFLVLTSKLSSAIKHFEYARALNPDELFADASYADALKDIGLLEEAAYIFEKILEERPDESGIKNALSSIYKNFGRFDEANELLRSCLSPDLLDPALHYNYSVSAKKEETEELLEHILKILEGCELTPSAKAMFFVAAANLLFKQENFALGMRFLKEGKEDYARANKYDFDHFRKGVHLSVKFFATRKYARYDGSPSETTPIFILGMPRSGTTLLEQMICSHDLVHGAGELESARLSITEAGGFSKPLDRDYIDRFRRGYFDRLAERNPRNLPFVTDKMPLNFRWIGFIRACMPEAKIIHIRRHPNAVCWSNYKTFFPAKGMGFTMLQESLGQYFQHYSDAMNFWKQEFPGEFKELYYEQLTADPEPLMRDVLSFIGIAWDPSVLSPDKNTRAIKTASQTQIRQKIYTGSSEEWKKYEEHIPTILKWTQPHVEVYEREIFALMDSSHMTQ